jgi:hypothetical protein
MARQLQSAPAMHSKISIHSLAGSRLAAASLFAIFTAGCAGGPDDVPLATQASNLDVSVGQFVGGPASFNGWCGQPGQTFGQGDFNGDGMQDLYCHDGPGVPGGYTKVALSLGATFDGTSDWLPAGWCTHPGSTMGTGDFNGDGMTDVYCSDLGAGGGSHIWVTRSTGTRFETYGSGRMLPASFCTDSSATLDTGDFNGDGRTDIYCHPAQGTSGHDTDIAVSIVDAGFVRYEGLSGWCSHAGATFGKGDFDGNGKTDFYCHDFADGTGSNQGTTWVALSNGSGFDYSEPWLNGWCMHRGASFGTGDFDADGKTDFYCHDFAEGANSGTTWTALSNGSGMVGAAWLMGFCTTPGSMFGTGDFDGNHTTDFYCHDQIGVAGSYGNTAVELSTGIGFVDGSIWKSGWCSHAGAQFGTGDFDGDGRTDISCHDYRTPSNPAGNTWIAHSRPR